MSVVALTGIIRSGKSIEGVKIMIDNLIRMRHIYTNMDGWDDMKYLRGVIGHVAAETNEQDYDILKRIHHLSPLDVSHFYDFVKHESSVICIDEAHDHMDSREWDENNRKEMNTWIKKSGKHGHELILITQDVDELDKRIKTLIAWTYVFQKVDYLGQFVKNKFSCDQFRNANIKKKPFKTFHRSYDAKLFPCFKSFADDHIVEATAIAKPNILNHWSIKVAVLAVVVMVYFIFKSSLFSGDLFGAKKLTTKNQERIAALSHSTLVKNSSKPNIIEYKDLIKKPVQAPLVNNSKSSFVSSSPVIPPVKCTKIVDVEFNNIHLVRNDCGVYEEEFRNGVMVAKHDHDRKVNSVPYGLSVSIEDTKASQKNDELKSIVSSYNSKQ